MLGGQDFILNSDLQSDQQADNYRHSTDAGSCFVMELLGAFAERSIGCDMEMQMRKTDNQECGCTAGNQSNEKDIYHLAKSKTILCAADSAGAKWSGR